MEQASRRLSIDSEEVILVKGANRPPTVRRLPALGQIALAVPVAARVVGQLLANTTPPWRRAILFVVLADALIGAVEAIQSPSI